MPISEEHRIQRFNKELARSRSEKTGLELLVEVSDKSRAQKDLSRFADIAGVFRHIPYIAVRCDFYDAEALAESAKSNLYFSFVRSVDAVSTFHAKPVRISRHTPSLKASKTWNLEDIGAYEAQQLATGKGVKAAIIDTGINYKHPEVRERLEGDR